MGQQAFQIVYNLPSTGEEMVDIAREVIHQDNSRANYMDTIETFEQIAQTMREYLAYMDRMKAETSDKTESTNTDF